jgi:hypothetical protein
MISPLTRRISALTEAGSKSMPVFSRKAALIWEKVPSFAPNLSLVKIWIIVTQWDTALRNLRITTAVMPSTTNNHLSA